MSSCAQVGFNELLAVGEKRTHHILSHGIIVCPRQSLWALPCCTVVSTCSTLVELWAIY